MSGRRLFHFSDDGSIETFEPRPVRVPTERPPGQEWLNGPLVWAVDDAHEAPYLFPRDTARVVLWAMPQTTDADRSRWLGEHEIVAYVEAAGLASVSTATIFRYELPPESFVATSDGWMWVSAEAVTPLSVDALTDLPAELAVRGVDLRVSDDLTALRGAWDSSVHASGIRLRHATTWRGV